MLGFIWGALVGVALASDGIKFKTVNAYEKAQIDKVLEIHVANERIIARMSGRRVCEQCGASYHIEYKPTTKEGICDVCGGKTVQRADDAPETVLSRLDVYEEKTAPLKDYYWETGKLVTVEGQEEVADTTALVFQALGISE